MAVGSHLNRYFSFSWPLFLSKSTNLTHKSPKTKPSIIFHQWTKSCSNSFSIASILAKFIFFYFSCSSWSNFTMQTWYKILYYSLIWEESLRDCALFYFYFRDIYVNVKRTRLNFQICNLKILFSNLVVVFLTWVILPDCST